MSQSTQELSFGADIYFYFKEVRLKGKKIQKKIRVRISEKNDNGYYTLQRVRDGYVSHVQNIERLTKE